MWGEEVLQGRRYRCHLGEWNSWTTRDVSHVQDLFVSYTRFIYFLFQGCSYFVYRVC